MLQKGRIRSATFMAKATLSRPDGDDTIVVTVVEIGDDEVTIDGNPTPWKFGRVELDIKPGQNSLGAVKVSPSMFVLEEE